MIDSGGARGMRRWSAGIVACALAVPLLLAGCAEKHQASQSLPTTSRTTASKALPPLGPADFPVPAEARQRTTDGVIAFTKYYVQLMNRQAQTLNSQPLRDLSSNCQTCDALADSYDKEKQANHKFVGGDISITSTGSAVINGDEGEISFFLLEQPTKIVDASGSPVEERSSSAKKYGGGLRLTWDKSRSGWIVIQLDADPL